MKFVRLSGIHIGEKHAFTIWYVTEKIGVFPVNVHGGYRSQCFMVKMVHRLSQTKRLNMSRTYSVNMAQISGLNGMQKIYYLKDLRLHIVRMESLQKKRILWTFGLTLVLPTKQY